MADGTKAKEYLVDIDLGTNGGRVRIRDLAELQQWVKQEKEFWDWAITGKVSNKFNFITNTFNSELSQVETRIKQAKEVNLLEARPHFESFMNKYKDRTLIYSGSREAQFVMELRDSVGAFEALVALGMLMKQHDNLIANQRDMGNLDIWRGIVGLVMLQQGISESAVAANRCALDKLAHQYNERLSNYDAAADELKTRLDQLVSEHQGSWEQGKKNIARFSKLARERLRLQRAKVSHELEEIKKLYSAKLGLEAPVEYWNKKSLRHQKWMKWLFVAFGLYTAAVGIVLYEMVLDDPTVWKDAGLELVGLTLAAFGMLVAVARILYKLAASQLHLYNDADERGIMVEAYLALRMGGHADETHMQIVLERLFAPGTDGIVKDEFLVTAIDHIRAGIGRQ